MKILSLNVCRILALTVCLLLPGCAPSTAPPPTGSSLTVAFSPQGTSLELVLSCIEAAERDILVAAYSFTSKPISTALLDAHKRDVKVQVVADKKGNSSRYTAVTFLANQGIPVRLNGRYAIHHHKFMVIDGKHVETGSFNYSAAATDKNAENVLVLWDVPELAAQYAVEWQRLWNEAEPLPAKY
jgi:phosphatidylserine/phosphatidylglycerophosphate/cardiolipin synthase-like enzyme